MPSVASQAMQVLQARQQLPQQPQPSPNGSTNLGVPILLAIVATAALAITVFLVVRLIRQNKRAKAVPPFPFATHAFSGNYSSERPSTQGTLIKDRLSNESAIIDPALQRSDTAGTSITNKSGSTDSNSNAAVVVVPTLTRYSVVPEYGEIRASSVPRPRSIVPPPPQSTINRLQGSVGSAILPLSAVQNKNRTSVLTRSESNHKRSRTLPHANENEEVVLDIINPNEQHQHDSRRDTELRMLPQRQSSIVPAPMGLSTMPAPAVPTTNYGTGSYEGRPLSAFQRLSRPIAPLNLDSTATTTQSSLRTPGSSKPGDASFTLQQTMRKRAGQLKPTSKRKERPQSLMLEPPVRRPDVIISMSPGPGGFVIDE